MILTLIQSAAKIAVKSLASRGLSSFKNQILDDNVFPPNLRRFPAYLSATLQKSLTSYGGG